MLHLYKILTNIPLLNILVTADQLKLIVYLNLSN